MFDPSRHRLRPQIGAGDTLGVVWLALGGAALAEAAARAGPDAIVLDLQHGLWDRVGMEQAVGAVSGRVPVLARVADGGATAIGQALDAGCEGVIVPMVESAAEAAAAVAHAHYPPRGRRSAGGVRPLADLAAYLGGIGAAPVVAVMVETAAGVAAAGAIAAVPGVDMVFIGTGDLALSLGERPGSGAHEAACAAVLAACGAAGRPCGIFTGGPAEAAARRAQGYRMVVTATDQGALDEAFGAAARAFRAGP
ncbi:MAG: hypothetical protein KJZ85_15540 [Rhodobacteraceae bacterium]|jgi:2-dehydro-3-deoxyglucarate aldolase/4-hydroxy-2-oxoheptanedioate aldolase|nr:hypothetical protein [Paracoccaceae bacterium]